MRMATESAVSQPQATPRHGGDARLNLLILSLYPADTAPSARFRYEQFLPALAEAGFACTVAPFFTAESYAKARHGGIGAVGPLVGGLLRRIGLLTAGVQPDVVLVHREAVPLASALFEKLFAGRVRVPLVFDFDDAIWLAEGYRSAPGFAFRSGRKTQAILRRAALVLAGNAHIAEFARAHAGDVRVVPTVVDTERRFSVMHIHRPGKVTIGWTGSRSTAHELEALAPVLQRIEEERPFTSFTVISDSHPDLGLANQRNIAWSPQTEIRPLIGVDIGLMPLQDTRWNLGKCGFKLIQYMALGIVPVASPVGANREIVEHEVCGLFCDGPDDWFAGLMRLIDDHRLRATMAVRARERVVERYSVAAQLPHLIAALEAAAARPGARRAGAATPVAERLT